MSGSARGSGSRRDSSGDSRSGPLRFAFLEIRYGCHDRHVAFPSEPSPFVIQGPNATGKSTLMESLVRTLYGFNRRLPDDRQLFESRRPWHGEEYRGMVGLEGPCGAVRVERDFETDRVVVRREGEERPEFQGTANPAGAGQELRSFRRLLEGLLGLADRDDYERTACVHQGALIATRLSEDLLQIAAGGHADVESAREVIRSERYALTVEPVAEGEAPRRKPGEVERRRERLARLRERREEARAAERRREPLLRERDRLRDRLRGLHEQLERLEEALEGLAEIEALAAAREAAGERLSRLEAARREVDEALARWSLVAEREGATRRRRYPADFAERAAALEEGLWPRIRAIEEEAERLRGAAGASEEPPASRWMAGAGGIGLTVGVILALVGAVAAGAGLAALGALLLLLAAGARRRTRATRAERERRAAELQEELDGLRARARDKLGGVPDAETLSPATLPDRRREFQVQLQDERLREEAVATLRVAMDRARQALRRAEEGGEGGAPPDGRELDDAQPGPMRREETLGRRAADLLRRLEGAAAREREDRLAPATVELRRLSASQFALPDGVERSAAGVRAALQARRAEEREVRDELARTERELAYEARPAQSSVALDDQVDAARARLRELEIRAEACRRAFALVSEAYEDFRRGDQARLIDGVSRHLERASRGELGPVLAEEGLENARVLADRRRLALASPPLSYGQLHTVLFAVRLGAADFLAGLGVRLPLLVDDPFVHLDEGRAAEVWRVLCRVAEERQVVVATQDRLLLEHLGVAPDLVFGD